MGRLSTDNEGDTDERRADAYMQAFEQTLANSMWMPIVGNHEFYAGTNLTRYLDSTWQKWGPIPGGEWEPASPTNSHNDQSAATVGDDGDSRVTAAAALDGATSATSALGAFLSAGNHHGPAAHGSVPSGTSRWFSVDFGLTHLVALSLNSYNGLDLCDHIINAASRVNRGRTNARARNQFASRTHRSAAQCWCC